MVILYRKIRFLGTISVETTVLLAASIRRSVCSSPEIVLEWLLFLAPCMFAGDVFAVN